MVTVKKIESSHLREVNDELAKSLGVATATVQGLRDDIAKNLSREVKNRVMSRNKQTALDVLVGKSELELPQSIVKAEIDRLVEEARENLKQRGIKDADKAPMPEDLFRPQAENRVRMGLVVSELVRTQQLTATLDQIKAQVNEMAASYEKPEEVVRWYFSDNRRLSEIEAMVIENNVTDHIYSKAKVSTKAMPFDELMGR